MTATRVLRIDLDAENGTLAPPKQLPTGSWVIEGYATRAGVFKYLEPDGTPRLEYRSPEEVEKSASNLVHRVLTNRHPEGRVTPKNANALQQGVVLDATWEPEGQRIKVSCLVTTEELLESIGAGRRELSCGYEADVVAEAGVSPGGDAYTHVQRDIQHNHLAVVDAGRAGPTCALRLDAQGDAVGVVPVSPPIPAPLAANPVSPPPIRGVEEKPMVKVVINGVEYEVPEAVAVALQAERDAMKAKLMEAEKAESSALEDVKEKQALVVAADTAKAEVAAKLDTAEKSLKATQVKLDEAKDEVRTLKRERADGSSEAVIQKRVMERTDLQTKVSDVLGKNYDYATASNQKLRVDALEKVLEGREASKKRLAGYVAAKDDASISALFDHIFEERADGAPALGGSHSTPTNQPGKDVFALGMERLKEGQKAQKSQKS